MLKPTLCALATVGAATAMVASAARTQESFFMALLLSLLREEKTIGPSSRSGNCPGTFLNGCSGKLLVRNDVPVNKNHRSHELEESAKSADSHRRESNVGVPAVYVGDFSVNRARNGMLLLPTSAVPSISAK